MEDTMKKLLAFATLAAVLEVPTVASAGGGYGTQPGYAKATANTSCAGAGAFGAFGTSGDGAHDFGVGNITNSNGPSGVDGTQDRGSTTPVSAVTADANALRPFTVASRSRARARERVAEGGASPRRPPRSLTRA